MAYKGSPCGPARRTLHRAPLRANIRGHADLNTPMKERPPLKLVNYEDALDVPRCGSMIGAKPSFVLLVEDDVLLRDKILAPALRHFGFEVMTVGTAKEMRAVLSQCTPDIVLLDVELPDSHGFDLAHWLRVEDPQSGIVLLTGRSRNSDLVRGLTEGADAYLSKPAEIDVIVATLFSVARRLPPMSSSKGCTWHLSPDAWFLIAPSNARVRLSKAERRLLEALMKHPNEVVLRDNLIAAMTDDVFEFDPHRLDSILHRLRRKVLTIVGEPFPLDAVHGIGYLLVI
jgi:DNA-binding response OmpR family regulator